MASSNENSGLFVRSSDYRKLLLAHTVLWFGSQFSTLAIPATAVYILGTSSSEVGLIGAMTPVSLLLLGLVAGVWVDSHTRRPVLIVTSIARALLLALIPVAAWLGMLNIVLLLGLALLIGIFTAFFQTAELPYRATLIPPQEAIEANRRLMWGESAARILGPTLAGLIMGVLTPMLALLFDSAALLVAVLTLGRIRKEEPEIAPRASRSSFQETISDAVEGLREVYRNPVLRALTGAAAVFTLSTAMINAVLVTFMARELKIDAAGLGLVTALGTGLGFVIGGLAENWIISRLGVGRAVLFALIFAVGRGLIIPFAQGTAISAGFVLIVGLFCYGCGAVVFNSIERSLRQVIVKPDMQGRVNAAVVILCDGIPVVVGAILGGRLGDIIGLRSTLVVAGLIGVISALLLAISPVRRRHGL